MLLPVLPSLLLAAGCGSVRPAPEPTPEAPEAMAEMAAKKAVKQPGEVHLDPIDWKAAFERQRIDPAYVTDAVTRARAESDVPILLPNEPAMLGDLKIYSGKGWYSATVADDAHQIMIRGSRAARSVAWTVEQKARTGALGEVVFTSTEGIVTASFSLYGAAYNLEIECTRGEAGDACRDEATARQYVEKLGLAGDMP